MDSTPPDRFLNAREAAELVGLSEEAVRNGEEGTNELLRIKLGELGKLRKRIVFGYNDVQAWIVRRAAEQAGESLDAQNQQAEEKLQRAVQTIAEKPGATSDRFLNIKEVAKMIGLKWTTISDRRYGTGELLRIRLSEKCVRFSFKDVQRWMAQRVRESEEDRRWREWAIANKQAIKDAEKVKRRRAVENTLKTIINGGRYDMRVYRKRRDRG